MATLAFVDSVPAAAPAVISQCFTRTTRLAMLKANIEMQEAKSELGSTPMWEVAAGPYHASVSIIQRRMGAAAPTLFIYLYRIVSLIFFFLKIEVSTVPPAKLWWSEGRAEQTQPVCVTQECDGSQITTCVCVCV